MKMKWIRLTLLLFLAPAALAAPVKNSVKISPKTQKALNIKTIIVRRKAAFLSLLLPGTIVPPPGNLHTLHAPVTGAVLEATPSVGEWVKKGEVVAVIRQTLTAPEETQIRMQRLDYLNRRVEAAARLSEARNNLLLKRKALERDRALYKIQAIALQDLQIAQADYQNAFLEYKAAKRELRLYAAISPEPGGEAQVRDFPIISPIDGVVTATNITRSELVSPQDVLYVIADPSRIWVKVHVYEKDLSRIHPGQTASISSLAYPGRIFKGEVKIVGVSLDPENHTLPVVIELANPRLLLKFGMMVSAKIQTAEEVGLFIPDSCLIHANGQTFVYLKKGDSAFVRTRVTVRPAGPGGVQVLKLTGGFPEVISGDRVVTDGIYVLEQQWVNLNTPKKAGNEGEDND